MIVLDGTGFFVTEHGGALFYVVLALIALTAAITLLFEAYQLRRSDAPITTFSRYAIGKFRKTTNVLVFLFGVLVGHIFFGN